MLTIVFSLWALSPAARACTACFGQQTDSPMASGMNWGIVSLLAVVLTVLGGLASAFFLLIRKSGSPLEFGAEGGPEMVTRER